MSTTTPESPAVPGWDDYFLGIARAVSRRGDCTRRQVGAVLVDAKEREEDSFITGNGSGVLIDEDETELAVRVLHTAYGLDAE